MGGIPEVRARPSPCLAPKSEKASGRGGFTRLRKLLLLIAAAVVMSTFGPSTEASADGWRYRPVVVSVVHRVVVPTTRVVWQPVVVRTYAVRYYRTYAVRYAAVYHRPCCCQRVYARWWW
jgi:hypothetical protein